MKPNKDRRVRASKDVRFTQWAVVHQSEKFTSLEPYSGYIQALPEDNGTVTYLEPEPSEETLGSALLDVLDRSRFFHPDEVPGFYKADRIVKANQHWNQEFMTRFGYKTKKDAYKTMTYCRVTRREGQITIKPTVAINRNIGQIFPGIGSSSFRRRPIR